jgi:hypothetical protein
MVIRDLVRTCHTESSIHENYLYFFLSGDSEEASGQVKGTGSICSDRDASLLKKLEAGEDLYPFCDASVWLRSCSQEVVEPLEGKITGKSETCESHRTQKSLISHIFPSMFANGVNDYVGVEVLTGVVMKSTIFWDITLCSPLKVNRRFGRTYRLHLQGRRISRARNQRGSRCLLGGIFLRTVG